MKRTRTLPTSGILMVLAAMFMIGCSGDTGSSAKVNPAPSAAPAAQPPPAAAAAPAESAPLALLGKFVLEPPRGPWATRVTATATGMAPNTAYELVWTSVKGTWKLANQNTEYVGREYSSTSRSLATVTADAQGNFTTTFVVPDDFGFQHDVLVKQGSEIRNKFGFDVDMQVSISPTSGPPGTPITIEAKGIGWRQMENSWLVSYDNAFTGWLSSVSTTGYAKALIPAAGLPGVHMVTVLHGDFTFPYLNMQQSPEPNRPQFHIPFTLTEGTPVLPAAAASQMLPVRAAQPSADGVAMWLDPPEGVVGSQAALTARALIPNTDVEISWSTVTGNRVSGSGWEERTKTIGRAKTDARGNIVWGFAVPDDLGGVHALMVKAGDQVLAQGEFVITPSARPLSVERGPSGTEVTIHLKGVGWTETANIYNIVYDNGYAGYACGFNSGGDVQIIMRVSGAPGWHFIDLYPGIYKGKETRPLNFRVPQLTYADDHPGERLPAFRYAFYVTPE